MRSASVHVRGVRAVEVAATLSWTLPLAAAALVGLADAVAARVRVPNDLLLMTAVAAAVPGLALGVAALWGGARLGELADEGAAIRRRGLRGIATSALVLVLVVAGAVAGAASGRTAQAGLKSATDEAVREFPGWNGGAAFGNVRVVAYEIDVGSSLAKTLAASFDVPVRIVAFGIDNRAGDHEAVLELDAATLHHAQGTTRALGHAELLRHAAAGQESTIESRLAPARVVAGGRLDGAFAFLPCDASLKDVGSIDVRLDGQSRAVPGRYFTLEEKRAIERARGGR
jgi:hypothetical protein